MPCLNGEIPHAMLACLPPSGFVGTTNTQPHPRTAPYAYKRVSDDKLVLHADRGGKVRQNKKRHHDRSAVELEQLEIGDQVVIQDPKTSTWSNKGLITDI